MRRIRAFGCSLTQQHHWKYLVKNFSNDLNGQEEGFTEWKQGNIHLTDYSFSGCGNDIQHIQYANEVYYENILKDDIILWQLSSPDRVAIINETDTDEHYVFNRGPRNVFTGEKINILHLKGSMYKHNQRGNTITTYSTLWQLNGVKRNNDKLLVIFGWDSCFVNEEKKEIIKFLKEHDIDYIEESILGWSTRHKFFNKGINDDIHPPQQGYKSFTEDCLLPKLKKLKWLD